MKKKMWLLILTVIALALLTGCGVKVASEKQMKEDLYNSNEFARFSNELGMEIIDFDVEKRQTSPGDKLDTAWIKISAKSNAVLGEMYYMMLYKLYNDGWLLEQITDDRTDAWRFEPLCGVADETIEHYLPEGAEVLGNQVDLDTAKHTVTYTYTEGHRYCDVVYNRQVIFDFGTTYSPFGTCMPGQWSFGDVVDVGSYEDWDIVGTWYAKNDEADGIYEYGTRFRIDEFSPTGIREERLQQDTYEEMMQLQGFYEQYRIGIKDGVESYYDTAEGPFEVGIVSNETNPHLGDYYIDMSKYQSEIYRYMRGPFASIKIFFDYDNLWFDTWQKGHVHTELIRDMRE